MTPRIVSIAVEGVCSWSKGSPHLHSFRPPDTFGKEEAGVRTVGTLAGWRRQQVTNDLFSRWYDHGSIYRVVIFGPGGLRPSSLVT